jgi:hypothetical protein
VLKSGVADGTRYCIAARRNTHSVHTTGVTLKLKGLHIQHAPYTIPLQGFSNYTLSIPANSDQALPREISPLCKRVPHLKLLLKACAELSEVKCTRGKFKA